MTSPHTPTISPAWLLQVCCIHRTLVLGILQAPNVTRVKPCWGRQALRETKRRPSLLQTSPQVDLLP